MMRRAVITGATGVIGTALVQDLIKENIEVLVLCRKDSKRIRNIPKHPLVTMKYCSLEQLSSIENDTGKEFDVFYHFAWDGTVGAERHNMYLQNQNVRYALDAVGMAMRFGCKRFIGAGSQAEYGRSEVPLRPDTPTFPETGYGYAKLCAGQMTRDYAHQHGLEHIWVRILSVYGPNDGKSMIMSAIEKLKKGEVAQFTKGEQIWDYLYSSDAARAFRLLGNEGVDGKIYVLGSGRTRLLSEYVEAIRNIVNPDGRVEMGRVPYGKDQIMFLCADTSMLQDDIGWKAEVSFEDGIREIYSRY